MMQTFSLKWFTLYYFLLGIIFIGTGGTWLFYPGRLNRYINEKTTAEKHPPLFKSVLKYFLVFTIPTLILSFFPFSWVELLFSLWCLFMIYVLGSFLLNWEQVRPALVSRQEKMRANARLAGAIMVSAGLVMFLLCYQLLSQNLGS